MFLGLCPRWPPYLIDHPNSYITRMSLSRDTSREMSYITLCKTHQVSTKFKCMNFFGHREKNDKEFNIHEKMSAQVKEGVKPESGAVKVTAKKHRWYLGGIASAMAASCTHPLDLLKVSLKAFLRKLSKKCKVRSSHQFGRCRMR